MDSNISFVEHDGHARITLAGVRTPAILLAAAAQTAVECRVRGIQRFLIDVRGMRGALDTLEAYEVAGHDLLAQDGIRELVRVAVLDRHENIVRVRFFETVAVNRGLDLKVFDDEAQAMRWLAKG